MSNLYSFSITKEGGGSLMLLTLVELTITHKSIEE